MRKRQWLIRGYRSDTVIYEGKIDVGQITEVQMKALLRALTAKAGLTYDEIVGAHASVRTKRHNDLLLVHKDLGPLMSCGTNPFFTAKVVSG